MEKNKLPLLLHIVLVLVLVSGDNGGDNGILAPSKLKMFVDELPDMPRLQGFDVKDGVPVSKNLTIGMYDTFWKFHRDLPPTRVFAYGTSKEAATVPGPTIQAYQGVPTYITWTNHLPAHHFLPLDPTITSAAPGSGVPTVVHVHGGVQPPASDGNAFAWYTASFAATGVHFVSPVHTYPNLQPPGNLWYHDHAMGLTRVNILAGLLGAYRISAPSEQSLGLPSGVDLDRHLVLFDRTFRTDGSFYMNRTGDNPKIHPQWQPEYFGPTIAVNGKAWPFLSVRRRRYRFRIINASNARFFRLYFSNGLKFVHVASDSVYLAKPVKTRRFLIAPSEIADVVVDFAHSSTDHAIVLNDAAFPYPSGDPTDKINGKVMKFIIRPKRHDDIELDESHVPKKLMPYPKPDPRGASVSRYITMYEYESSTGEPTHLYLNAKSYMDPITETPKEGTDEIWNVINLTDDNHPLHVHLAVFTVLEQRELVDADRFKDCMEEKNNAEACRVHEHAVGRRRKIPRQEAGWKNVFKMRPGCITRILVRFRPLLSEERTFLFDVTAEPGYVYHCHILDHEDNEMMRPYKLVR